MTEKAEFLPFRLDFKAFKLDNPIIPGCNQISRSSDGQRICSREDTLLPSQSDRSSGSSTLPSELNPLSNPLLAENLRRWAEVYFSNPPERREQAISELLRELQEQRAQQRAADSGACPVADPEPGTEMILRAALGMSLMYTRGPVGEAESIWARVLELADRLGDAEYQLRALYGLWLYRLLVCEFRVALELSERFRQVAEHGATSADVPTADRMAALTLHFLGDQASARVYAERALAAGKSAFSHYQLRNRSPSGIVCVLVSVAVAARPARPSDTDDNRRRRGGCADRACEFDVHRAGRWRLSHFDSLGRCCGS